jgi:hypothetical protein
LRKNHLAEGIAKKRDARAGSRATVEDLPLLKAFVKLSPDNASKPHATSFHAASRDMALKISAPL